MMRATTARRRPEGAMRYAERQNSATVTDLSSWRLYGPATRLWVESAGTVTVLAWNQSLGWVGFSLVNPEPGVWHDMPPFTGFSGTNTCGEVAVGYM